MIATFATVSSVLFFGAGVGLFAGLLTLIGFLSWAVSENAWGRRRHEAGAALP